MRGGVDSDQDNELSGQGIFKSEWEGQRKLKGYEVGVLGGMLGSKIWEIARSREGMGGPFWGSGGRNE